MGSKGRSFEEGNGWKTSRKGDLQKGRYTNYPSIFGISKPGLVAVPCFVLASHMNTCAFPEHYALIQSHVLEPLPLPTLGLYNTHLWQTFHHLNPLYINPLLLFPHPHHYYHSLPLLSQTSSHTPPTHPITTLSSSENPYPGTARFSGAGPFLTRPEMS